MVNFLAVLVAAIVSMGIGALWYNVLFGKLMAKLSGKTPEDTEKKATWVVYVLDFISLFVTAYVLGIFLDYVNVYNVLVSMFVGFIAWLGFIATNTLGGVLWEKKPWSVYLLKNAHHLITFIVIGLILGLWA